MVLSWLGDSLRRLAGCLPLALRRRRRCEATRGRESAAAGRLGPKSTRSAKCCLAPGVLRRLWGWRGPARNRADWDAKVQDCKRGSVSPPSLSPQPLQCDFTARGGGRRPPASLSGAAVTDDLVTDDLPLDGFDESMCPGTFLEARSPKARGQQGKKPFLACLLASGGRHPSLALQSLPPTSHGFLCLCHLLLL